MTNASLVFIIDLYFWALYKMFNIIKDKSQLLCNIVKCSNTKKSKIDDYLAIFVFKLLLYVILADAWLGEIGKNFVWK